MREMTVLGQKFNINPRASYVIVLINKREEMISLDQFENLVKILLDKKVDFILVNKTIIAKKQISHIAPINENLL